MGVMETGYDVGDWIQLTEDRVYWWAFACMVMNILFPNNEQSFD
jgi:hypothetical protein